MTTLPFYVAEIDVYRPGGASAMVGLVLGEAPIGQVLPDATGAADSSTLRVSDLGYVTRSTDPDGTLPYVPTLEQAFALNVFVNLAIDAVGASYSYGTARLSADGARGLDTDSRNVSGREVRILTGNKTLDTSRNWWVDPAYASLTPVFTGLADQWQSDDTGLSIEIRDPTLWLERELQSSVYAGTGTTEGTATMAGRARPKLRGGALGKPVLNISPVLIDPVANIWQYNDAAGKIEGLYEDGYNGINFSSNTTNLWAGSTPAGFYRTDDSKGLFQLGSPAAGRITIDAYGSFPAAGLVSKAALIARYLMTEDLALPASYVDTAAFAAIDALYPYEAGWYWDGSTAAGGQAAVGLFLASLGCRLVPTRSGQLSVMALRSLSSSATPAASYTTAQIVTAKRTPLPEGLAPPPYRLRWGYQHVHAVMDTAISPSVSDTRKAFLKEADRFAVWTSTAVSAAYRRPSDPAPLPTALIDQADAAAVVAAMGALWGIDAGRRLYQVELPAAIGLLRDVGDVVSIAYPIDGMDDGRLGLIVGESFRSQDSTNIITVMV